MIQRQIWKDEIRILITDEQNHGSVQISIPRYECNISGKADALIYALYVDSSYRRKGIATKLLWLAERQIKLSGLQIAGIEFDKEESESFVLAWYLKNGYKPFSKRSKLLIKELED
uniref:GNAT family N-acetyltransferase n=1 Tax=Prevotella sp. TaxID=59823 RepID=UPI00206397E3|nr:MAG TPA: acetyltransferase domain containing protein [Caudoviricetes sp.]DAQ40615.1 MAG TPA: acetyltransferase domain containing protein [Caudoviricetes sp.]